MRSVRRSRFSDSITLLDSSGILSLDFFGDAFALDEGGDYVSATVGSAYFDCWAFSCDEFVLSTPFAAGVPISITGNLWAEALDFAPDDPSDGAGYARALLGLNSVTALSSGGTPLVGFHYQSESNTDYGITGGIFVPSKTLAVPHRLYSPSRLAISPGMAGDGGRTSACRDIGFSSRQMTGSHGFKDFS
jgi:hypothetical protein